MRRAAKIDTIHPQVRDLFKAHGCEWADTSTTGKGFPDALACYSGRIILLEIKSGDRAMKRTGKTAEAQKVFAARFPVCRIGSEADALNVIRELKGCFF
jgi:hypothetical protein